ncbi:rod shape-determining protein [Streptomyces europaeiscabiei]|uniref:rod shape-determining protein n=1 Tax=Streptomyces europaeiscabiei TaxID=146819 RepID=UPI0029BE86BB|nr:rod shape-determining protein [Streptomyces europaeiscabiei]MDX3611286.1 rod shape-determining protein [Streptomyces europaeiscabiei]
MSVYFAPADGSATTWPVCRRCPGIALDLGSSRTRAWVPGHGIILDVPTITVEDAAGSHPIQRGTIVDPEGTAQMLQRHLGPRIPRHTRPLIALTTPVLGGIAYRKAARTALEVLRPRTVFTIPTATAVALGADANMSRPLLIVDIGAHLTEVFLLTDGSVVDAHRTALGTDDLDQATTHRTLTDAVTGTVTDMLHRDHTTQTLDAVQSGVLLAGGGALRPGFAHQLTHDLHVPVRPLPDPHTAALRGAAKILQSARGHPSITHFAGHPPPQ